MDFLDQLPLFSTARFPEPLEVETRQCLCLHVTAALTGERSLSGDRTSAFVFATKCCRKPWRPLHIWKMLLPMLARLGLSFAMMRTTVSTPIMRKIIVPSPCLRRHFSMGRSSLFSVFPSQAALKGTLFGGTEPLLFTVELPFIDNTLTFLPRTTTPCSSTWSSQIVSFEKLTLKAGPPCWIAQALLGSSSLHVPHLVLDVIAHKIPQTPCGIQHCLPGLRGVSRLVFRVAPPVVRSGGYPKIWDLPCMQRLRQQTGARTVPLHMCAWHLQAWELRQVCFIRRQLGGWYRPSCSLPLQALPRGQHRPPACSARWTQPPPRLHCPTLCRLGLGHACATWRAAVPTAFSGAGLPACRLL